MCKYNYKLEKNVVLRILFALLLMMTAGTAVAQTTSTVNTDSKSNSTVNTEADTKTIVISPPGSAISPNVSASSSDLCTVGVAGAVQTQILGISSGETVRDPNCERLKLSKTLYDMGMKVAAVSVMCQDPRVFDAMMNAGTPCPYDGKIGAEAKAAWATHQEENEEEGLNVTEKTAAGAGGLGALLALLLLL